jgi:beta-phosphoglucomutase
MTLKAIFLDFSGVILNDGAIHEQILENLLINENLRYQRGEFRKFCLGRSDRASLVDIFQRRDRFVSEGYLSLLARRKAEAYQTFLANLPQLPIYPELSKFIAKVQAMNYKIAVITGRDRSSVEFVLECAGLLTAFDTIISNDDIIGSKPSPEGYLLALAQLNNAYPDLALKPSECLSIEGSFPGIQAARQAQIQVVGLAHSYPLHIMQRLGDWAIDSLADLEWERVEKKFSPV